MSHVDTQHDLSRRTETTGWALQAHEPVPDADAVAGVRPDSAVANAFEQGRGQRASSGTRTDTDTYHVEPQHGPGRRG